MYMLESLNFKNLFGFSGVSDMEESAWRRVNPSQLNRARVLAIGRLLFDDSLVLSKACSLFRQGYTPNVGVKI